VGLIKQRNGEVQVGYGKGGIDLERLAELRCRVFVLVLLEVGNSDVIVTISAFFDRARRRSSFSRRLFSRASRARTGNQASPDYCYQCAKACNVAKEPLVRFHPVILAEPLVPE